MDNNTRFQGSKVSYLEVIIVVSISIAFWVIRHLVLRS